MATQPESWTQSSQLKWRRQIELPADRGSAAAFFAVKADTFWLTGSTDGAAATWATRSASPQRMLSSTGRPRIGSGAAPTLRRSVTLEPKASAIFEQRVVVGGSHLAVGSSQFEA